MGANYAEYSNKEKNTLLFMSLGKEGQRQFLSLPNAKNFDRTHKEVKTDVHELFAKKDKIHTLVARYNFLERNQLAQESLSEWLTELRIISADCQWSNEDDLIATRLIHGSYSDEARKKVFAEHPDTPPDFDTVV